MQVLSAREAEYKSSLHSQASHPKINENNSRLKKNKEGLVNCLPTHRKKYFANSENESKKYLLYIVKLLLQPQTIEKKEEDARRRGARVTYIVVFILKKA